MMMTTTKSVLSLVLVLVNVFRYTLFVCMSYADGSS